MKGVVIPITMHLVCGGSWLTQRLCLPFKDFAGTEVVHLSGEFCGHVDVSLLGEDKNLEKSDPKTKRDIETFR